MKFCKGLAIFLFFCLIQFTVSRPRNIIRPKSQGKHIANGNQLQLDDTKYRRPALHKLVAPKSTVRITCNIVGHWNRFLGWYKPNGRRVISRLPWFHRVYVRRRRRFQYTLVIQNVDVGDGGRYICRGTRSSSSFTLLVAYKLNAPVNQNIGSVGGNGTIQLGAKGFPMPGYQWKKDSKQLDLKSERYSVARDGSLTITNLQLSDAGTYVCTVYQLFGKEQTVSIHATVKPAEVPKEYPEEENAGDEFIEGDIYVDKHTQAVIESLLGRDALSNPVQHWPDGIVPYKFAANVGEAARKAFKEATQEYHKHTCIRLIPRTVQRDYIYVVNEKGCFSTIGRSGNWQKLSLGPRCERKGTAIHEIMHALGFFHEQSRLDRDGYVTINWANIKAKMKFNFQKYRHGQADTLGAPYDYGSIMHYPEYAFSSNRKPTIVKKKAGPAIGQRIRLSETDILQINKLYKCNKRNTSPTPSQTPTTRKPTTKPTTRQPVRATKALVRCYDLHYGCPYFTFYGYCNHYLYGNWMKRNCPRSCRFCR